MSLFLLWIDLSLIQYVTLAVKCTSSSFRCHSKVYVQLLIFLTKFITVRDFVLDTLSLSYTFVDKFNGKAFCCLKEF